MTRWRLTRAAADDLTQIYLDGLTLFGMDQADNYHSGLESTFDFLGRYPRAARLRLAIQPPVRAHPHKAHLIVYDIADDGSVIILRIRHSRENWQDDTV